jgi:UDP-N-acetylmuramoylalanine--D-glutamate ligase
MRTMAAPLTSLRDLAGSRVVVLGLARSGTAAARALADAGADVVVYDRRSADELADAVRALDGRRVRLELGASPEPVRNLLSNADLVVMSPSISPRFSTTEPWLRDALAGAEAAGVELTSEVDLFLRLTPSRVVAVTGTKGKTTVTSLIGEMLQAGSVPNAVGGNIGTPLIERLAELTPEHWAVVELSELQLPTISRGTDVAVYTNIVADHLDRHGSVEAYRAVKARLARLTITRGTVVLNADDPGCLELAGALAGVPRWYGFDDRSLQATVDQGQIYLGNASLMPAAEVPLPGRHMLANALAAALGASCAGAEPEPIATAIRGFRGVPHRLEVVGEWGRVRYVNDSQATIPMAAIAALHAFDAPIVLIAGGQGKGLEYGDLADTIAARCRGAVLVGETATELERLIGARVPVTRAETMGAAVAAARELARPGDVVLLAPAATSFDMFADYAARGDAFRAAVTAAAGATGEGAPR